VGLNSARLAPAYPPLALFSVPVIILEPIKRVAAYLAATLLHRALPHAAALERTYPVRIVRDVCEWRAKCLARTNIPWCAP
jgi:hypothetical protein